ncbi:hypothetical protein TrRE_jg3651, partial [Triparma retinervis]
MPFSKLFGGSSKKPSMDKQLGKYVKDLLGGDVGKINAAIVAIIGLVGDGPKSKKSVFEYEGIMSGLIKVAEKEGEEYKMARGNALGAMLNIANSTPEVTKGMFEYEGLMSCLMKVAEKEGEEYKVAREKALWAMLNIATGEPEVKMGMFEYEGLMSCLVKVVEKEGEEYKTLFNFVTNKGAGRAGGGSADVESAALAVEALLELSYPSPSSASSSTTAALDILTKKVDTSLGPLTDLLKIYSTHASVTSSTSYSYAAATATALMDRINLLKNATSTNKAISILKTAVRRRSNVGSLPAPPEDKASAAANAAALEDLMKAKEALERQVANSKRQEKKLQEELAKAKENENKSVAEVQQMLTQKEVKKTQERTNDTQEQLASMMALLQGLHVKTDSISADIQEVKATVNATLTSLQNFYTGKSEVPRYILVVPFVEAKASDKVSRFFKSPKKFFLSEPTAKLIVLCSYDFSAAMEFQIDEPKQFVKDHAATIKMTLKGLRMMSKVAGVGTKILTGASLPFELPSTESFDSFLDSADGMVEGALELAGEEGSEEREAVRKIGVSEDGNVEGIKKAVGSAYRKLKDFFEQDEKRMKKLKKAMEHITGSDGNEEWVKKENLDAFHRDR